MALTLDSSITRIVTKSGTEITKVIRKSDGAVLWPLSTPYYVVFTDYPLTVSISRGDVKTAEVLSTGYRLRTKKNPDAIEFGQVEASAAFPTNGCKKVDVTYTCSKVADASLNNTAIVNGYTDLTNGTYTFDCSGDTFTLTMRVVEATAYNTAELLITEIHFY